METVNTKLGGNKADSAINVQSIKSSPDNFKSKKH